MKALVRGFSRAVARLPVVVIVVVLVASFVLGGLGGGFFAQEEGGNEVFAPDNPEILAAERIGDLFGEDSAESVVQVIVSAPGGNVISAGGAATVQRAAAAIEAGAVGPRLSRRADRPAIVSFLTPLEQAGLDVAALDDAALAAAFRDAVAELPPEQLGFVQGLLPAGVDPAAASSERGLMLAFIQGVDANSEFDELIEDENAMADDLAALDLPAGFTAEPFSFELVFGTQDEFQQEVGRLFAAAGFIILLILATVFILVPRNRRGRWVTVGGIAVLVAGAALLVLEVVPPPVTLALYAVVFLTWTFTAPGLRRTVADTLLTMVTILLAINVVAGAWFLLYNETNPMTQIIPILLIGLGVDYSIHLNSRYRDEVSAGRSVDDAIRAAIRTVGVALVLATVTTAVGFLTNLFNEIRALQQFGVLSAIGIAAAFVLMLTFVPAIRELLDRRAVRAGRFEPAALEGGESRLLPRLAGRTAWLARRAPVATLVVVLALGALGAFGVTRLETKFSFLDFVPTSSPLRDTFETLLDEFGGGFGETTQVLVEGDVDSPEGWNAVAASIGNAADTPNVLQFGEQPAVEAPHAVVAQLGDDATPGFDPALAAAADAAGLAPDLTVSPDADVTALLDAAVAAAPDQMGRLVHASGGGYDAMLVDVTTQAGEQGAGDLRVDLNEDFEPAHAAGLEARATSDEIINDVIVTTLRDSQLSSLFITLAAALLLLVINFWVEARRPMLGVITTIPVVLVVVWGFGIMAALGIPFGPVTATIAALAIGIGIPYMIHITHRYEEDRVRLPDPDAAVQSTLTHTGGALAGSAFTTMAGFGILTTSTTVPFQQLGFVTAYTIGLALLGGVLVLPSMLVLWDRWHRRRGEEPIDAEALHRALDDESLPAEPQPALD